MKLYTDGFLIGQNPSTIGGGYTVVDSTGIIVSQQTFKKSGFTNNDAELLGVLMAAAIGEPGGVISTDAMVITHWVRSGKPKARPDLTVLCQIAKKLIELKKLSLIWEPRELNLAGIENEKNLKYDKSTLL